MKRWIDNCEQKEQRWIDSQTFDRNVENRIKLEIT